MKFYSIKPCRYCGGPFKPISNMNAYCSMKCALFSRINIQESNACWLWNGPFRNHDGYGMFQHQGLRYDSHRAMWTLVNGHISEGMHVLHRCDNPSCCNPTHLFAGTNQDNQADCYAKGRRAKGEQNGFAKLTEQAVREILAANKTQRTLAKEYGVNQTIISDIRRRETWKHV